MLRHHFHTIPLRPAHHQLHHIPKLALDIAKNRILPNLAFLHTSGTPPLEHVHIIRRYQQHEIVTGVVCGCVLAFLRLRQDANSCQPVD